MEMYEHESRDRLLKKAEIYRELSEYYSGVLYSGKTVVMHIGTLLAIRLAVPDIVAGTADDYNRLFIAPHTRLAPPQADAYCEDRPLAMRLETLRVRQICEEAGLDMLQQEEAGDHLHYAFAYMSCLLEALARRHLDMRLADRLWDTYQLFLRDHLLSWIFEHLDDVRRRSESVFCQSVAAAACSFLQTEQEAMYFEVREA